MNHLDDVDLVYFVQAVDNQLIKIGLTRNFPQRWSTLCTQNAGQLTALGVQLAQDAARLERRLHRRFDPHKHHGEWFNPAPLILEYIADVTIKPDHVDVAVVAFECGDVDAILNAGLPSLLTVDEIARELRVTTTTVRRHVKERGLPCVRVGGQLRFDIGDLIRDAHVRPRRKVWAV